MPDGVVLLDGENTILWANDRYRTWADQHDVIGENFYQSLNSPEILGPDYCPFHTALASRKPSSSTLRAGENHYFQVHAAPVQDADANRNVSSYVLALDAAGTLRVTGSERFRGSANANERREERRDDRGDRRDDRGEARDTRQEGREAAREAKEECKKTEGKSNRECRQEKRDAKDDARDAARDIKRN